MPIINQVNIETDLQFLSKLAMIFDFGYIPYSVSLTDKKILP
jgi:hypothetical protein